LKRFIRLSSFLSIIFHLGRKNTSQFKIGENYNAYITFDKIDINIFKDFLKPL